jgi:hypothetical protein
MYVGWIFAGSVGAAIAVALLGFDLGPVNEAGLRVSRLVQIMPLMLPSIGMLIVGAILGATEGRRSGVAGELLHASGWAFAVTYVSLALATRDSMKVGAALLFLGWVLMALSTIKFAPSDAHKSDAHKE